jgi:hypothetical protein
MAPMESVSMRTSSVMLGSFRVRPRRCGWSLPVPGQSVTWRQSGQNPTRSN